ncbi:hypothetical protein AB0J68_14015, partial [Micromonospora sp. NPDC049580]|uniref:hypothetical protein n=1 Tax=Micromonospora sp. NPDC049580 TaxID=3154832 RepID=UPI00341416D6
NDGGAITVRQLLQQTSGLPDYDDVLFTQPQDTAAAARTVRPAASARRSDDRVRAMSASRDAGLLTPIFGGKCP